MILVLLISGAVLFRPDIEPPDFVVGSGDSFLIDSEVSSPEGPIASDRLPGAQSFSVSMPTPSIAAINAVAPFEVPLKIPASFPVSDGQLSRLIRTKLANLGAQRAGGDASEHRSRFFGSREDPAGKMKGIQFQGRNIGASAVTMGQRKGSLVGTMYDLKQMRNGTDSGIDERKFRDVVTRFGNENFRASILQDFYRAEIPLYASSFMIPEIDAARGPEAFGLSEIEPSHWVIHYRGRVSPPRSSTFRFVGGGDDILLVKFNGVLVLDRSYTIDTNWKADSYYDYQTGYMGGFARSDPVKATAGEWYDLEILLGEEGGNRFQASLLIEEEGVNYEKDASGNPILPVFRFSDEPLPELEEGQKYPPHMETGPIWRAEPEIPSGGAGTTRGVHRSFP